MKRLLLAGLALASLAGPAHAANDWWLLSFKDGTCVHAIEEFPNLNTPLKSYDAFRNSGRLVDLKTYKKTDGTIDYVTIGDQKHAVYWFPSHAGCVDGKKGSIADGSMPDFDALR